VGKLGEVKYSVVIPAYNEEEVIDESYRRLKKVMDSTGEPYELIFINDGSRDSTAEKLRNLVAVDDNVKMLGFSRNFGHQTAITAGMDHASGEAILIIDADLQDPPEVMLDMIEKWKAGYMVVYGKRLKRKGETFFKTFTAKVFYRILNALTDVSIPVDTGDFRLIDRKVCDTLKSMPERNRYVRGLVSWVGFKQTAVEYVREERFAGETKYPLKKMLKLAFDGLSSFSYKPLRLSSLLGFLVLVLSVFYFLFIIVRNILVDPNLSPLYTVGGFSFLLNGIILLMIGILGEYISRISDESKGRPLYIIDDKEGFGPLQKGSDFDEELDNR
jgi:glycosyltransferase involved in cell wall biosynthesis